MPVTERGRLTITSASYGISLVVFVSYSDNVRLGTLISVWNGLLNALGHRTSHVRDLSAGDVIMMAEEVLALAKRRARDARLSEWRRRMADLGKPASRWLKQDICSTPASLVGPLAIKAALKAVLQDVCEELQRVREGRLSCPSGPRLPDLRLTGEELLAAARKKAGGASGACGWSGDEVANWPLVLWQALAGLLRRWNERGSYPEVWQHYRQVTLAKREPKDGKLA
ncbi:unnamed protein product, partial [Symbiodinium pilosum]